MLHRQTLKEAEFLCIDDGSQDSSGRILDEYAAKDSRFKVVHQQNQGAAGARNAGLDMATGEWVAFIDPDDYYPSNDTLRTMYENAVRHNVSICGGSVYVVKSKGLRIKKRHSGEFSGYQFHRNGVVSFGDYQFDYGFWRFLYKRELIEENKLRFPPLRMFEDPPFMVRAFSLAGSFYAMQAPTYMYLDGNGWAKTDWTANNCLRARHMLEGMSQVLELAEAGGLDKLRLRRLRNLFAGGGEIFQRRAVSDAIKEEYSSVIKRHTPLVTVVVPVYNDERHVGECLDSILSQSYRNIEVVCVNDGSTDRTPLILEHYEGKYDPFFRIVTISQENRGLSAARNAGMRHATGKYVYFLDSDDMLNHKDAILEMVLLAEEHHLDQLIFGCRVFADGKEAGLHKRVEEEKAYHAVYEPLKDAVLPGTELFSRLEDNDHFFATQQTRFYLLRSLTDNGLAYPEGLLHEDNYMGPASLRFAERAMIVDRQFVARRIRAGSIVTGTGDMSKRFAGLWGVVQLLCRDKRLWETTEDFQNMLRKFIHNRIGEMFWLARNTHDETLLAQKMLVLSSVRTGRRKEARKGRHGFLKKLLSLWRTQ